MFIYEVTGSDPPIRFAAGEFSNGVGVSSFPALPQACAAIVRQLMCGIQPLIATWAGTGRATR